MKIFNVIHFYYVAYECSSRTTVMSCSTLKEATEYALELYNKQYKRSDREDSFHCYSFFDSVLDIFNKPSPYAKDYVDEFYVIEVELNTPIDDRNPNIVWSISEQDVFNLFKNDLNAVFQRESTTPLESFEVTELFNKFKSNRSDFCQPFSRKDGYLDQTSAGLLSMTSANQDDIWFYNKYELNFN